LTFGRGANVNFILHYTIKKNNVKFIKMTIITITGRQSAPTACFFASVDNQRNQAIFELLIVCGYIYLKLIFRDNIDSEQMCLLLVYCEINESIKGGEKNGI
jgi:hypothetical protein